MTKVDYIVVSFLVYTSGDMRNNLQNTRKQSFSFSVVNKNIENNHMAIIYLIDIIYIM